MDAQKRICVINDISCEGRCSVTAALPIYSAAGIHGNLVPTALLSTQTGGYDDYTCLDLSDEIMGIVKHFERLGLKFDVLYTGYLAGDRQIELVMKAADILKADTLIVDPVMGDGGKLYDGFTMDYCKGMRRLCKKADVILPNLTEACFLTGCDYDRFNEQCLNEIISRLKDMGVKRAVITGVSDGTGQRVGIVALDGDHTYTEMNGRIEGVFHGAGDVFGAAFACGIAKGEPMYEAAKTAHYFTHRAIEVTAMAGTDTRQGLCFEKCLGIIFDKYNK